MDKVLPISSFALIEPSGSGPAHRRLAAGIRIAIQQGRLRPGDALPASRNLAADLGVSRWVVTEAYQQLVAEGYLAARVGSATRVAATAVGATVAEPLAGGTGEALPLGTVDLRPGLPDPAAFPRAAWSRAYASVLRTLGPEQLGYPDPQGVLDLRATVAQYLHRVRGVPADPRTLVITAGTADAMRRLSRLLAAAGSRRVAVEDPGWPALGAAAVAEGLSIVPVPVDREGLIVDQLPGDLDAVLVTPAHQFPTGVTLSASRRAQLLAWAAKTQAIIIEDDYDAEFRYDRRPIGALAGLDPSRVIYLGSVSKTLSPALRLGWLAAPFSVVQPVTDAFAGSTRSALEQHALATFIAGGEYDRHLRRMRRHYQVRRDGLLTGLRAASATLDIPGVAAGLHLLVRLPDQVTETRVHQRLAENDVWATPLSRYQHSRHDAGIVFGFARLRPRHAALVSGRVAAALQAGLTPG
ncbi:MocR-like pyridoxine biosynthesis transcription factor PdxR [Geodermatophilus sp. SYSU D00700]